MQGLILAAGMGKRLKNLTSDRTKCMVEVNGVPLINRMLSQLDKLNLSRIVIVIGYMGDKLVDHIGTLGIKTPVIYVTNETFRETNNIYSLYLAREHLLREDTILLESDLIFEDSVLTTLIEDPRETLALVSKYEPWMDGTCVKIGKKGKIGKFIPKSEFKFEDISSYYKTVNIYKFSKHFSETHYVPFLEAYSKALGNNEYYEQVLRVITMLDDPEIKAKKIDGHSWYEIDDLQDLDIASSIFTDSPESRLENLQNRYGGYWRYPHLLDFCYLVNPYFPPQRMMDEIKSNFETLLTQYPSGMQVNSRLAMKNFGVDESEIVIGNGAAELIKHLMERLGGVNGFIRPAFEEYINRNESECVVFTPTNDDYSYTSDDLIDFFKEKRINNLILINPDNPSGNYIPHCDLIRLATWCKTENVRLIVDESFVDFADETSASLISENILNQYPDLVVIKSLSKSYGIAGIRLGIMASHDSELIEEVKHKVSIWNINSFGEFFMQIFEKYIPEYTSALSQIKDARHKLFEDLNTFESIRAIKSDANYIMAEVVGGMTAKELTMKLLSDHDILIKDLSSKKGIDGRQFVRIAVRNEQDNNRLIRAMRHILQ